ncbi:MAG: exopolysaccharide biosynthesis polyprenyl glycosylphosphotransferase [Spirochaetales bacterium]|uniref:Exopolysaccharide biosynthesis polyprenyl glycosylphosphotransferase n=1 Tax=Candidatus Thalassospirochaeta sargassi TaxID=3119039 RepID=A0AAJ1MKN6_9SPIO|nr:exopolysaccharide biosynthesis polyprenyl glycosylphosphotransferase [Spirochaetales bacterium]
MLIILKLYDVILGRDAGQLKYRIDIVSLVLFSIVNYLILWRRLFSKPYHIYLKGAFSISVTTIWGMLVAFTLVDLIVEGLLGFKLVSAPLKYGLASICFLVMIGIQYVWIIYLARLGFFRKNTLIVGIYDERIPLENLFQDLYGTKHCVGQIMKQEGQWMFRADVEENFKPVTTGIYELIGRNNVNEMLLCMTPFVDEEELNRLAAHCHENSIGYYLISDIRQLPHSFPWNRTLEQIPVVERFSPNRDSIIMVSLKRILDVLSTGLGLIFLSPIFLVIGAAIAAADGFPVIYKSTRIGIHGKPIRFYKFRTMVKNAEALKAELLKHNERPDGRLFKMENDPRITKIGRFLRQTSLDELPQLWNVLRGDMSLIGPRPHLPEEVEEYAGQDHLRLECIPGISCLPQIRGRNDLGFREWVDLDLEYRKNWTMGYDLKILWHTVGVVLKPILSKICKS